MADDAEHGQDCEINSNISEKATRNKKKKKELKPGIIYLSRIPPFMSVKKIRQLLSVHGEIGRIFLQPDDKATGKKKNRTFTEGWLEFLDKRIAKQVALSLNNSRIGGKKRSRWFDELWNIKYLHSFKWGHLNERLAYERAVHKQRLRTEIAQVKRETNFYIQNVEKNKRLAKLEKQQKDKGSDNDDRNWTFKQKETDDSIINQKRKIEDAAGSGKSKKTKLTGDPDKKAALNKSFLKNIFSGGLSCEDADL